MRVLMCLVVLLVGAARAGAETIVDLSVLGTTKPGLQSEGGVVPAVRACWEQHGTDALDTVAFVALDDKGRASAVELAPSGRAALDKCLRKALSGYAGRATAGPGAIVLSLQVYRGQLVASISGPGDGAATKAIDVGFVGDTDARWRNDRRPDIQACWRTHVRPEQEAVRDVLVEVTAVNGPLRASGSGIADLDTCVGKVVRDAVGDTKPFRVLVTMQPIAEAARAWIGGSRVRAEEVWPREAYGAIEVHRQRAALAACVRRRQEPGRVAFYRHGNKVKVAGLGDAAIEKCLTGVLGTLEVSRPVVGILVVGPPLHLAKAEVWTLGSGQAVDVLEPPMAACWNLRSGIEEVAWTETAALVSVDDEGRVTSIDLAPTGEAEVDGCLREAMGRYTGAPGVVALVARLSSVTAERDGKLTAGVSSGGPQKGRLVTTVVLATDRDVVRRLQDRPAGFEECWEKTVKLKGVRNVAILVDLAKGTSDGSGLPELDACVAEVVRGGLGPGATSAVLISLQPEQKGDRTLSGKAEAVFSGTWAGTKDVPWRMGSVIALYRLRAQLLACASTHGPLVFILQIDGKGRVATQKVAGLGAPKVEKCVAKVLKSISVEPPARPTWVVGAIELVAPR
jgi:hypothetical protein